MDFQEKTLSEQEVKNIFKIEENHFNDFKAKEISGNKLSKAVSAFCNSSGGDVYVGIREDNDTKNKHWDGFKCVEDTNSLIQVIESMKGIAGNYGIEFLLHPVLNTYLLHIVLFKSPVIVYTTDDRIFIRKGAQSLPVDTEESKRRLELDKGISSFEDEPISNSSINDALDS